MYVMSDNQSWSLVSANITDINRIKLTVNIVNMLNKPNHSNGDYKHHK